MDNVVIVNQTPYNNLFTKLVIGAGVVWVGSIIARKTIFKTPAHEHSQNKRYMIKSQEKISKDIAHLNGNTPGKHLKPNYFGRHKRFNKI